ncbi:MAG: crossover junction endodeoxyribonuclease RuvC [Parcubacteria group bacterium CG1_02_37_51]|uniref:Crossover junction endodeoxyribonuclease RuvC n=2 Tax=Candidatus Komeiliibacteriota TaxID=1817908 RepID=A0A2M8DQ23_9BACT|nr:MAG: crossover junction endodeoxyribonuclease RuvC [Parcubacteria group bacterium CG1_02_37_51]PIY94220.1 MAG: crossover junction endodeoxyribonuclease RuvC [Candidatus Komeilibacteria bacterium CG_4_10_14_0_8_um_filter_37_78]PJC01061.1 MAG: crossover junction endodeoxyribonuclease RuvC [Candidatus Komeilibacteria bacterium CG_4_9_14_0_8_um_filter_36_9]
MTILGIDPGFADTGFGIIKKQGEKIIPVDYGSIQTVAKQPFEDRLFYIYTQTLSLLKNYRPDYIAIEELFFFRNTTTVIKVSQARGVIILAAKQTKTPIYEFTPLQIKQALTGYGRADKNQMGNMVKAILNLDKIPKPDDASDALAAALCCLSSLKMKKLGK